VVEELNKEIVGLGDSVDKIYKHSSSKLQTSNSGASIALIQYFVQQYVIGKDAYFQALFNPIFN
jgi:hypothetical protein